MEKYLIAHDLGTSGNKASLFSTKGQLIRSCTVPYDVHFFGSNCAEQNPDDWWNAVCGATKEIISGIDPKDVLALSFSSQMQACVAVDRSGNPLRPAIIWADGRSACQEKQLTGAVGFENMFKINGHRPSPNYSIEKLMWIRDNKPEIYAKTYKLLLAKDFIICRLTGEFVTDHSEATGTDIYDITKAVWSEEIIKASGISPSLLPEIHASTDIIGSLKAESAAALGLTTSTAVVCGGSDGACSALGAGSIKDGQYFLSFGTSAWIAGTSDSVFLDEDKKLICFGHVVPGRYMPCGTMQAAGSSYAYIKKLFFGDTKEINGHSVYDEMSSLAEKSPAGAKGLIFLPYLLGERSPRWNPDTSGSFLGIRMEHDKGDYIRAVLEGIAMNLKIILQAQEEKCPVKELILTGGGAKGNTTAQILSDVLGIPLLRLDEVETATSVAAAVIAGVGVGVFDDFSVVNNFVHVKDIFEPDTSLRELYDRQQILFEEGYQDLLSYFPKDCETRKNNGF